MIKISFSTLGCPDWTLKEILASASDLGYDGVEIRGVANQIYVPEITEFCGENLKNTIDSFKKRNVEIPLLSSGANLADEQNVSSELKEAFDYIDLAEKMSVKNVRVLCDLKPEISGAVNTEFVSSKLKTVCDYALKKGVTVLIETNGFFANTDNMLKLIEETDKENLAVLWDIHHPIRFFGEKPSYTYGKLKRYIKHVHVKDSSFENGKVKYEMLGYGDMPIKEIISLLKQNGFDGYVSLEWVKRWNKELLSAGIVFPQFIFEMKRLVK